MKAHHESRQSLGFGQFYLSLLLCHGSLRSKQGRRLCHSTLQVGQCGQRLAGVGVTSVGQFERLPAVEALQLQQQFVSLVACAFKFGLAHRGIKLHLVHLNLVDVTLCKLLLVELAHLVGQGSTLRQFSAKFVVVYNRSERLVCLGK